MNDNQDICLVILAGGQSRRMGSDKAIIEFKGQRLIDRLISRFQSKVSRLFLSANQDYDSGLPFIPDDPSSPAGPVGGIFSITEYLQKNEAHISCFSTVPVDAPLISWDLMARLLANSTSAVASCEDQLHPTFANWQCATVGAVRTTHDPGDKSPSLHWLARKCGAEIIDWNDKNAFANINTPNDLKKLRHLYDQE